MMTMGHLYDALKQIEDAEKQVASWEHAVENGGAPDTITRKHEGLQSAKDWLNFLRSERINDEYEL